MLLKRKDLNPFWTYRRDGKPIQVFGPKCSMQTTLNVRVMSIMIAPNYTKVHFRMVREISDLHLPEFSISPSIRLITPADPSAYNGEEQYKLLNHSQAPIFPNKIRPEPNGEPFYFTLVFEPIPCYHFECDIIEEDGNNDKLNIKSLSLMKDSREWEVPFSEN